MHYLYKTMVYEMYISLIEVFICFRNFKSFEDIHNFSISFHMRKFMGNSVF